MRWSTGSWRASKRPEETMASAAPTLPSAAALQRAARILAVRSRREVSSAFAGGYRSAFRGGGIEFEESRPYVPGDDVRHLAWKALPRTGSPYVKRVREERDLTVLLALDVSRSMAFASGARSKAALPAHAAALLVGAAPRPGARVGLVPSAETLLEHLPPERGAARLFALLRRLARATAAPAGRTDLGASLGELGPRRPRLAVVVLLSDFRDGGCEEGGGARPELARLARRHDVVAAVGEDRGGWRRPP